MEVSPVPVVLTSQYACSCLEREKRHRCFHGISNGTAAKQDTTVAHRHPDNTSANLPSQTNLPTIHTHTHHASSGSFSGTFQNRKRERKYFLTHIKSHPHNTRLLDGLNQNSPSQNLALNKVFMISKRLIP